MKAFLGASIAVQGLSVRYDGSRSAALEEIDLEIFGGVTALLGPNGSGKTTLLHTLLGLLPASAGQVLVAGRVQAQHSRRQLSRLVGLVPQEEHIAFDLSVLEYVLLGRAPYLGLLEQPGAEDRRIARAALEMAGISTLCERTVTSLSGGERQLVIIARALAQEPHILLLDEPTSHLDLANTRRVLGVLRELGRAGKTIVFSTHDPNAAAVAADHVVLLRQGRLLAAGAPAHSLTAEHLSATYGVPVHVANVAGRLLVVTE